MTELCVEGDGAHDGTGDIDELWNLHEDFSVADAAALVAGYSPTLVQRCEQDSRLIHKSFPRYPVVLDALSKAITNGRLNAAIRYSARDYGYADRMADIEYAELEVGAPEYGNTAEDDEELYVGRSSFFYKPFADWSLSTVARDDLIDWLQRRGVRSGFFFPAGTNSPDYLDPGNPRYAAKLAAAVHAWQAVTDSGGASPKQALAKWVREHAAEFGLTDDEGKLNETGIDEVAKVANWQPGGGAPKTPNE
ncbi:hypothetical protein [Cupriavidus sp. IDO]|uniref:hypothetical protein n=1 Tax=Cupriavidus sp. IDO TaxID=1539142 RepID=UPI00126A0C25|nr:hypothetical protein [Cupriavidus sp. IDO]